MIALRSCFLMTLSLIVFSQMACNVVPRRHLLMSQNQNRMLYDEVQGLAGENQQLQAEQMQNMQQLDSVAQQNDRLKKQLDIANSRLDNLNVERTELQDRFKNLLVKSGKQPSPLSKEATKRFEELANKYPDFEFDPQTGVSKFHSDILFSSGSATLRNTAVPLLKDFSAIMNEQDAKRLNILVVGHTDDQPIAKAKTKHPTNWHLSTNRANSVVSQLIKLGMDEHRLGAAGYSKNQPIVPNTNDMARQRNRRVEIYVLAPDAVVAGWDPHHVR